MPISVVDVDGWVTTFQSVADGEAVSQTNELIAAQDAADRTAFLRNRTLAGGNTLIWQAPLPALAGATGAGAVTFQSAARNWRHTAGSNIELIWALTFPFFSKGSPATGVWKIDNIRVWTQNATGHGGSAPVGAARQAMKLVHVAKSAAAVQITEFFDPSSAAVLDTRHEWSNGAGLNHTLLPESAYWLVWETEDTGANGQLNTDLFVVLFDLILV